MTYNQIEYAKHQESKRHNQVVEAQGERDVASRAITAQAAQTQATVADRRQQEDARHNRESEMINWFSANQDAVYKDRAGRAALTQAGAAVTSSQAALTSAGAAMLQAQTREIEAEIKQQEADTKQFQAATERVESAGRNLERVFNILETRRHNLVTEGQGLTGLDIRQQEADTKQYSADTDRARQRGQSFRDVTTGLRTITETGNSILKNALGGLLIG